MKVLKIQRLLAAIRKNVNNAIHRLLVAHWRHYFPHYLMATDSAVYQADLIQAAGSSILPRCRKT